MTRIVLLIIGIGVFTLNAHLRFSGDSMLVSKSNTPDGWYQQCTYYTPVRLITKTTRVGQVCERFAQL